MALQFPPTDLLPQPITGTQWLDPNGVVWTATVTTVDSTDVVSWTPNAVLQPGAFLYRGFADLTLPVPDAAATIGTIYSALATTAPNFINPEWGGLADDSGGTITVEANQLIICTQENTIAPLLSWGLVSTPTSPWIRDGDTIRPLNQGDSLEVKYNGAVGGDIKIENYTSLP